MNKLLTIPPEIKGLIFDCDGTLADTMPIHMVAWQKAFESFGEVYSVDFLRPLNGMSEEDIVRVYNKKFNRNVNPKELVNMKYSHFIKNIHLIKPISPVADLVCKNYNKFPMAVVSGGRKKSVVKTLQAIKLLDYFEIILTADDPIAPKPAPDIFLHAVEKINVSPTYCQVFEDGDVGLQGAKKAGMKTTDIRLYI